VNVTTRERSEHDAEAMPEELKQLAALAEQDHRLHIPRVQTSMSVLAWDGEVRRVRAEIRSIERELAEAAGWQRYTAKAAQEPGFHERNLRALDMLLARFREHGLESMFVVRKGADYHVDLIEAEHVQVRGPAGSI